MHLFSKLWYCARYFKDQLLQCIISLSYFVALYDESLNHVVQTDIGMILLGMLKQDNWTQKS